MLSVTDKIIAYEDGQLNERQIIRLFQKMINNGMVWQLQGCYGRTAMGLINAGLCRRAKQVRRKQVCEVVYDIGGEG